MMRIKKTLIANLLVIASTAAYGAGLGSITIKSSIGELLHAEIDILAVSKDELATLEAQLANPATYAERNVAFDPVLAGARVEVLRRADGQAYLRITSNRPISEPALDLVVELTWTGGQLLREYSAFMDPPGYVANLNVAKPVITVNPAVPVRAAPPSVVPEEKAKDEIAAAVVTPSRDAAAPNESAPNEAAPNEATPNEAAPNEAAPNEAAPNEATPIVAALTQAEEAPAPAAAESAGATIVLDDPITRLLQGTPALASMPANPSNNTEPVEQKLTPPAPAKATAPRRDALRLTATAVQADPKIAAERKILAERARVLEERLHAKRMELRDMDEQIASLQLTAAGERVRTLESMITSKSGELKAVDQQLLALQGGAEKTTTAVTESESTVAGGPDALRRLQSLALDVKPAGIPSATSLVQMVMPAITWITDKRHFSDPLVLAGGGLGVAMAGGLGIWMIRRRRKPDNAFLAMPAAASMAPVYIAPTEPIEPTSNDGAVGPVVELTDHLKAIERLAEQRNVAGFRRYAEEIAAATNRSGPVWEKIAAMGGVIDRFNPLYVVVRNNRTEEAARPPVELADANPTTNVPHMEFPRDWLTPERTRGPA